MKRIRGTMDTDSLTVKAVKPITLIEKEHSTMSLKQLCFSFKGRINRKTFWKFNFLYFRTYAVGS